MSWVVWLLPSVSFAGGGVRRPTPNERVDLSPFDAADTIVELNRSAVVCVSSALTSLLTTVSGCHFLALRKGISASDFFPDAGR